MVCPIIFRAQIRPKPCPTWPRHPKPVACCRCWASGKAAETYRRRPAPRRWTRSFVHCPAAAGRAPADEPQQIHRRRDGKPKMFRLEWEPSRIFRVSNQGNHGFYIMGFNGLLLTTNRYKHV